MKTKKLVGILALLAMTSGLTQAASLGTAFTYQGCLNYGAAPAQGIYNLQFTVYDAAAAGAAVGGPITSSPVSVSNGLFTVTLDFGSGVFTGDARWLEIGVHTNGGVGFSTLAPRQPLTPQPYALYASTAPLAEGSVTTGKILDGTILGTDLANNTVTGLQLGDDVELGSISANGELTLWSDANNLESIRLYGATHTIQVHDTSGDRTVSLSGGGASGGEINLWGPDGSLRANLNGSSSGASFLLRDAAGAATVQLRGDLGGRVEAADSFRLSTTLGGTELAALYEEAGAGGRLRTRDGNGFSTALLGGSFVAGGFLYLYQSNGLSTIDLDGDATGLNSGGALSIKQSDGAVGIYLDGDDGGGGSIGVRNNSGSDRVYIDGQGNSGGGQINVYTGDGGTGAILFGDVSGGGQMYLHNTNSAMRLWLDGYGTAGGGEVSLLANDGSTTVNLQGDSAGAGYVSVRNSTSSVRVALDGESTGTGGEMSVFDGDGTETVEILGALGTGYGSRIRLRQADGTEAIRLSSGEYAGDGALLTLRNAAGTELVEIDGDDGDAAPAIRIKGTNGTTRITLDGNVAGNGRITTQELQITGGSDLSEQFDINAANEHLQAGMVVCIDPRNPGQLVTSSRAYDRTVAGIISGAGGVSTGMLMGQQGTKADGKHPVALSGRVYCQCDASVGVIEPGDLLTTSATPGHAMKVTDHTRAQGAIIGKAMTALDSGQGLVLVLVSLQ